MPEGHTLHRIARDHTKWFGGQKLKISSPQGRFEVEAKTISGKKLQSVQAHGKHLFYHFSTNKVLHVHLGLYGKFRLHKLPEPEPKGAVRVRMIGEKHAFDLNGPNCCELLAFEEYQKLLGRLGQDPLRNDAQPEVAWQRISKSRSAIGSILLDQSIIAGIGNIYRAEILFAVKIHPEKIGRDLAEDQFKAIWKTTVDMMNIGVKYNRIIAVDPLVVQVPLGKLKSGERLNVYKHSHCRICGNGIRSWELANRKMFACESCQA